MSLTSKRVYVAGSGGMVGSAIARQLEDKGYNDLILPMSADLDLRDQSAVNNFFAAQKPEFVIVAAAKVGGILANDTLRAEFLYDNLMIEANVISASYAASVKKLIFLGSSCIYPRLAAQPLREEAMLTGPLEASNEPYAIAKIAGIKLCESYYRQYQANFYSVMPTNLYGPNDNFDLDSSHVIPALIRKFHEAKINDLPQVSIWGTGEPRREFLFVDDVAEAIVFLFEKVEAAAVYDMGTSHINIGSGKDLTIKELAAMVSRVVGYEGAVSYDASRPDGTPRKLLDVSRMTELGWKYRTALEDGLRITYDWFLKSYRGQ
jgi:GDP-L-fucose synthase